MPNIRLIIPSQLLLSLLLAATSIVCCLVGGETVCRLSHIGVGFRAYAAKMETNQQLLIENALADLGWAGETRSYGLQPAKIVLVGDSFTEGIGITPDRLFAAKLVEVMQTKFPNFGLLTYAGRGYGTLQELIALQRIAKTQSPEIIIIQACSNDLINNSLELEKQSFVQNALELRPYWQANGSTAGETKNITLEYPAVLGKIRPALEQRSALAWYLFSRFDQLLMRLAKSGVITTVENKIFIHGELWPPFVRAVDITESLLGEFVKSFPGAKIYLFVADDVEPNRSAIEAAAAKTGIRVINGVADLVRGASTPGLRTYLPDRVHWSERGHALVGKYLGEEFLKISERNVVVLK